MKKQINNVFKVFIFLLFSLQLSGQQQGESFCIPTTSNPDNFDFDWSIGSVEGTFEGTDRYYHLEESFLVIDGPGEVGISFDMVDYNNESIYANVFLDKDNNGTIDKVLFSHDFQGDYGGKFVISENLYNELTTYDSPRLIFDLKNKPEITSCSIDNDSEVFYVLHQPIIIITEIGAGVTSRSSTARRDGSKCNAFSFTLKDSNQMSFEIGTCTLTFDYPNVPSIIIPDYLGADCNNNYCKEYKLMFVQDNFPSDIDIEGDLYIKYKYYESPSPLTREFPVYFPPCGRPTGNSGNNRHNLKTNPNPIRAQATVSFRLEEPSHVTLFIMHPITGRTYYLYNDEHLSKGDFSIEIQGYDIDQGINVVVLQTDHSFVTEMIIKE